MKGEQSGACAGDRLFHLVDDGDVGAALSLAAQLLVRGRVRTRLRRPLRVSPMKYSATFIH